jgi:hypothetical protein
MANFFEQIDAKSRPKWQQGVPVPQAGAPSQSPPRKPRWQDGIPVQQAAPTAKWQQGAPVNPASPVAQAVMPQMHSSLTRDQSGQLIYDPVTSTDLEKRSDYGLQHPETLDPVDKVLLPYISPIAKVFNVLPDMATATLKGTRDMIAGVASAPFDLVGSDIGDDIRKNIPQIKTDRTRDDVAATVMQYAMPASAAAKAVSAIPAIEGASPVIRWLAGLLGAGAADAAVTDPDQAATIGDIFDVGPTNIEPDDSDIAKRMKVGAETIPIGGAIDGVFKAGNSALKQLTPLFLRFTKEGRAFEVGQQLKDAGVPEDVAAQSLNLAEGNYKPVVSDVVNTPEVQGMARSVVNAPEGAGLVNRVKDNEAAISENFDNAMTPTKGVPEGAAANEFQRQKTGKLAATDVRVASVENARNNVNAQTAANQAAVTANAGTRQDASATLSDLIEQERQNATDVKNGLYEQAKALGNGVDINPEALADIAGAVRADIGPLAAQDQSLNGILGDLNRLAPDGEAIPTGILGPDGAAITRAPEAQAVTLADLIDLRPRLSRAIEQATGKYRGDVVQRLSDLRSAIDGQINQLAEGEGPAIDALRAAETNFRENFAPVFREGQGGVIDKAAKTGNPVPPTATADVFLKSNAAKGAREAVEDLNRIFQGGADQAAARTAGRNYIVGLMADQVGANVTGPRVEQFIAKYGEAIDGIPGLRTEMQQMANRLNAGSARTATLDQGLADAQKARAGAEKSFDDSPAGLYLSGDANQTIDAAINSGQKMRQLVTAAKRDPVALADIKNKVKARINDMIRNDGSQTAGGTGKPGTNQAKALENKDVVVSLAKANDLLKAGTEQRKALEAIFSPAEMKSLDLYRKQLELAARITSMRGLKQSDSVLNTISAAQAGVGISQGAVKSGMMFRFLRWLDQHSLNTSGARLKLMTDALTDPELAGLLVKQYNEKSAPQVERFLNAHLANNVLAGDDR